VEKGWGGNKSPTLRYLGGFRMAFKVAEGGIGTYWYLFDIGSILPLLLTPCALIKHPVVPYPFGHLLAVELFQ
jgi:hypothetical protein